MDKKSSDFLNNLLETPSPSGYESQIQEIVRDYLQKDSDSMETDLHGNVIACKNPDAETRVLYDGHCDQIGMLVSYIDESGFIYSQPIGGWDPQQLIGQRMTIWAAGGPINAVIARKAIHLLNETERKQVVKLEELWLDIGAKDKSQAAELVAIGDPVTLELGIRPMLNNLANSPGMDDKTGLWVVIEAFRRAKKLNCSLYVVSAVQEEIGLRGATTAAHRVDPHVGIAVDVTHATDCPTIDKRQRGDLSLGGGPIVFRGPNINPEVCSRLQRVATENDIPFQMAAVGRACPNDANALQVSRDGVAAGLVSIPNRYMHSAVETICYDDLDSSADLLARFAESVSDSESFTP